MAQKEVIRLTDDDKPLIVVDKDTTKIITSKSDSDIIKKWFLGTDYKPAERDAIVKIMQHREIYPKDWVHDRELKSGLYPDISDPNFSLQLHNKQEFFEARAAAISALEGTDPCNASVNNVFETSPIQRLVARFLNPATPYNGLLLYHGVGVGKTCSAISVAEGFLKESPFAKIFIVVPQAISAGFKRTMFDPTKLKKINGEWASEQCTGMTYPNLAIQELSKTSKEGQEFSAEDISDAVDKKIRERYFRFGYLQFANWVLKQLRGIPSHFVGKVREEAENDMISKIFSDKLIIIDEAHNLRDIKSGFSMDMGDIAEEESEDIEDPAGSADDHVGGKRLTPLLRRIVKYAHGLRLLLMTATPMYNSAAEISHLLNLLIVNDTKDDSPDKLIGNIFQIDGKLKKGGDMIIRTYSQRYISYMRGENPYTFPLRLRPTGLPKKTAWPKIQKIGDKEKDIDLAEEDNNILQALPIVHVGPKEGTPIFNKLQQILKEGDPEDFKTETWVHLDVSNIVYPNELYGHNGWNSYFKETNAVGDGMKYQSFTWKGEEEDADNVDSIFEINNLMKFAPKMAKIVETVQKSDGINFIYSRYVKAGILPIAIALERQGWTRVFHNSSARQVYTGKDAKVPRQCAFCKNKENLHKDVKDHVFTPACYVLLTGNIMLTPNFADILNYVSRWSSDDKISPYGGRVKAILGSQITTEGLDLKCVRSVHILEPWYHLNRIEQIIGRAIRFCSHSDLPMNLRNCLVYLYALTLPRIETPDLHAYRLSAIKAKAIGAIQRHMKIAAMDCNLNIAGLLIRDLGEGLPKRNIIDSEKKPTNKYPLGDNKFSSTCDYLKDCDYDCVPIIKKGNEDKKKDIKTYTYSDAQKRLAEKEQRLKEIFSKDDIAYPIEEIRSKIYGDLPWEIVSKSLVNILENSSFRITRTDGVEGRLILQNNYILFQPIGVRAKQIPLAYRYSHMYKILPRENISPRRGSILGIQAVSASASASASDASAPAAPAPALALAADLTMDPIESFTKWMIAVDKMLKDSRARNTKIIKTWAPPPSKESSYQIKAWGWLLYHFSGMPEIRLIAAQYWTERAWTADERKQVLEKIIKEEVVNKDLTKALEKDIFKISDIKGFKWVDTSTFLIESYCLNKDEFGICASSFDSLISSKLGKPVNVKIDTGELFGFLVPRKDKTIVFKTLDRKNSKKITGAVGADCSVASDLGGHRGRIRDIQNKIRELKSDFDNYLIDDTDSEAARDIKGRAKRQEEPNFRHIDDLSHIYVCMYMETLLRLMDVKKCFDKRWFLNAVEASRAELKGR